MDGRPGSRYWELDPPPALAPFVERLWAQSIGEGEGLYRQPVLPDACIDVVALADEVLVAGPATRTATLELAPGALTVGVRFRTGAAPALLGVSAAELRDHDVGLDDLWGRTGATLQDRALDAIDWRPRLDALVDGLTGRLSGAITPDPVGVGIAGLLTARAGRPLPVLAGQVGLSERQLRRRVEDAVGYPPRLLARILRFQRFLQAARAAEPERSLAWLAADTGYADQAHLTRESRELAGLPPAALLNWEAERLAA